MFRIRESERSRLRPLPPRAATPHSSLLPLGPALPRPSPAFLTTLGSPPLVPADLITPRSPSPPPEDKGSNCPCGRLLTCSRRGVTEPAGLYLTWEAHQGLPTRPLPTSGWFQMSYRLKGEQPHWEFLPREIRWPLFETFPLGPAGGGRQGSEMIGSTPA